MAMVSIIRSVAKSFSWPGISDLGQEGLVRWLAAAQGKEPDPMVVQVHLGPHQAMRPMLRDLKFMTEQRHHAGLVGPAHKNHHPGRRSLQIETPVGRNRPAVPPTKLERDTVRIKVKLTKEVTTARAGFGVVFTIVSGSGTLWGGEGISGSGRYDLTALDGIAQIVVRADAKGAIVVHAELPYDGDVHTRNVVGPDILINVE